MKDSKEVLWHALSSEETLKQLNSSLCGLSEQETQKRLEENGKNTIKKKNSLRPLKILIEQFKSFLIYLLIIAGIISLIIKHNLDAIVIFAIVVVNATIGFTQQYKAEKTILNLRKFLTPKAKVLRQGILEKISSEFLVPGDIIVLEEGDSITADCRVLSSTNLQVNESSLTGESLPIEKSSSTLKDNIILANRKNMLFAGTQVVAGSVKAVVVSTGMNTEFGKIASTLQEIEVQETPMQKKLDKFSKQVGIIIVFLVVLIVLLGLTKQFDLIEMFLTAVALAVSAIPAGLPAVLAISFAISSYTMAKKNVIVRRLPAVESLGSVTMICSDKTGTLTEEKMQVQEIYANNNFYTKGGNELLLKNKKINPHKEKELLQLIKTSILCNNARFEKSEKGQLNLIGDPTEASLVSASLDLGLNKKELTEAFSRLTEIEFNSQRKMMSILRDNKRNNTLYTKGAIENILANSTSELISGQIRSLTDKRKKEIKEDAKKMESKALRVLAFAYKNLPKNAKPKEEGLIFLGFVGMIDPPRKEVKQAIKECRDSGIKIKILTGDSLNTAVAIAKQIGIFGKAIDSGQLDELTDDELKRNISKIEIFARITPEQKLRITKILQELGEVVAITGDGVNDALALKSADIGVAMGIRGTDLARDVSDIVLADDNFASIYEGVKMGRLTYDNIKKVVKYFLTVNFSALALISLTLLLGFPLPMLPLQILWLNLISDSLPALSLSFEKSLLNNKSPRTEKGLLSGIWAFIVVGGTIGFLAMLLTFLIGNNFYGLEISRTMVLTVGLLFEIVFVYSCRTDNFILNKEFFKNKYVNYAVVISIAAHLVLLYTHLGVLFGVVPLNIKQWLIVIPFALSGLILVEAWKFGKKYIKK